MDVLLEFPPIFHKCPRCERNGKRLGIKAAQNSVWFCSECDTYWYRWRERRIWGDLMEIANNI
jgi:transposase-like protein